MSKHQGMISMVLADQEAPDDFIEHALKEHESGIGFCVCIADGEKGLIKVDGSSEKTSLDQVKAVDEDYKDSTRFYYFAKFPNEFNEASIQPFPVLSDDADNLEMICLMDGNFDEKAIEGSKYSADYDVLTKYIQPAIKRIYKGCDKEIHDTMQEIATDPSLPDLINTFYKGRASIVLLASNGEYVIFGENALMTEYDWGWSSNPGTYGKKTVTERVKETVKGFGSRSLKGAAVTTSPTPGKVPANVTASGGDEHKYHAPPLNGTKKEKGEWYLKHNEGVIPPGYKDCPKILKEEFRPVKTLKDLGKATDAASKRPIADIVPVRQRNGGNRTEAVAPTEVLPIIPPPQLKKLAEFMKVDLVAKNNNEGRNILDPTRFAEFEKKHTTFAQAAGLKGLEETFPWIFEAYVKLGKDVGVEALALLALNLSMAYQAFLASEDDAEDNGEQEELDLNTEVVNDPPARQAVTRLNKPTSGFGSRKVS